MIKDLKNKTKKELLQLIDEMENGNSKSEVTTDITNISGNDDLIPNSILLIDSKGNINSFNKNTKELFAMGENELIDKNFFELKWKIINSDEKVFKKSSNPIYLSLKNSEFISNKIFSFKLSQSNRIKKILVNLRQNSKSKLFSLSLQEIDDMTEDNLNISHLKEVINQAKISIFTTDISGKTTFANPFTYDNSGYSQKDIIDKDPNSFNFAFKDINFHKNIRKMLQDGESWQGVLENKKKNGNNYYEDSFVFPLKDNQDRVIGYGAVKNDISDTYDNFNKINSLRKDNKKLLDNILDIIIRFDLNKNILFVNKAITNVINISPEDLIGKNIEDLDLIQEVKSCWNNNFENIDLKKGYNESDIYIKAYDKYFHNSFLAEYDEFGNIESYLSTSRDITEIKKSKLTLLDSKDRLHTIFHKAPYANYILDHHLNFVDFNKATLELFGYTKKDLLSNSLIELRLMQDEDIKKANIRLKNLEKGQSNEETEYSIKTKAGFYKQIIVKSSPINYKDEKYILASAYDITDRKLAEYELLMSEEKYKNLYNEAIIAMIRISSNNGKVITANKTAAELFGYGNVNDFIENFDAISHYDKPEERTRLKDTLKEKKIIDENEVLFKKKDGSKIWLSVSEKLFDEYSFIEIALLDITAKKETEELKKCYLEISDLMNSIGDLNNLFIAISDCIKKYIDDVKIGIGMMDSGVNMLFFPFFEDSTEDEYTIISLEDSDNLASDVVKHKDTIYYNKNHLELFYRKNLTTPKGTLPNYWIGIPLMLNEEILGTIILQRYNLQKAFTLNEIDLLESIAKQLSNAVARQRSEDEIKIINKNLEERIFDRTTKLEDSAEELRVEVANRFKAQEELQAAKDKLEKSLEAEKELSDLKTRFVSVVSHEYRTPLTVILLATDLLDICYTNRIKKEYDKSINKIRVSVNKMSSLLEDVLIYGKASKNRLSYKPMSFNILDLLENSINDVTAMNQGRNEIIWSNKVKESNIYSDESLLSHIITNLISNAAKYSPNGKPVNISLIENEDSFIFEVTDQGIGIPEKDLKHLFTAFHRSTNTGAIEGTGLGLSIVKQCVDALNGKITVDTKENLGSTFRVVFPKEI